MFLGLNFVRKVYFSLVFCIVVICEIQDSNHEFQEPEKITVKMGTLWGCAKNSGACDILGQELAC